MVIYMARVTVSIEGRLAGELGIARLYMSGNSVREVLNYLKEKFSLLGKAFEYREVEILLNGQNISILYKKENTELEDFDVLRIVRKNKYILISSPVSINDMKKIKL